MRPPVLLSRLIALLRDAPRFGSALRRAGTAYMALTNRGERLEAGPEGQGYRCLWNWTSDLRPPMLLPSLGRALLDRSLRDFPIEFSDRAVASEEPEISFVIGHRGATRLPHLLKTLETIAAQRGARVECIVVEQDAKSHLASQLPAWVRHVHTPLARGEMPYCRSWALNVGARCARSPVLVLHDNDMLVPAGYSSRILAHVTQGYEVVNLKRFVFYLTPDHTRACFQGVAGLAAQPPLAITQNLEAGGSLAITSAAYAEIGGLDERFIGWGGEDNEFWERASTRRVWNWAYLPIVHLWHPAQPAKAERSNPTLALYRQLSAVPPATRIRELLARNRGCAGGTSAQPVAGEGGR